MGSLLKQSLPWCSSKLIYKVSDFNQDQSHLLKTYLTIISITNICSIKNIKDLHLQLTQNNNITIHNNKPTFYVNDLEISGIDHIYSTCLDKLSHTTIISNGYSDHAILSTIYHTKPLPNNPKIIKSKA